MNTYAVIGIFYTCSTAPASLLDPVLGIVGVGGGAVAVRLAGGAVAVVIVVGGHLPTVAGVGGGASRPVVAEGLRMPLLVGGGRGQGI